MIIFKKLYIVTLVLLVHQCHGKILFADESFQFLRSPNGEIIIGLIGDLFYPPYPPDFKLEIDHQGNPLIMHIKGPIYTIHSDTHVIEKSMDLNRRANYRLSPDKTKLLIMGYYESSNDFLVFDWVNQKKILEGVGKPYFLSFLNGGRFLLHHERNSDSGILYDLQEGTQITLDFTNILQVLEIQPEQSCAVGIHGEKVSVGEDMYEIKETYYHRWNYIDHTVVEHVLLKNAKQYNRYDKLFINFLRPVHDRNEMIGVVSQQTGNWQPAYRFNLWDIQSGEEIMITPNDLIDYYGEPVDISLDGQWLLAYEWPIFVNITNLRETGIVDESIGGHYLVYEKQKELLHLYGTPNGIFEIYQYDVVNKHYKKGFPLLGRPLLAQEAVFSSSNQLITSSNSGNDWKWEHQWDFDTRSVSNFSFPNDLDRIRRVACFSPDDTRAVGIADQSIKILNGALDTILHSLTVSETDDRYQAAFSPEGSRLLVATGRETDPGADNLIRIYETMNFEAVRDLRGHTDSVWYADFSPDGRRIVSASRDGTAKVWDTETGAIVSDFVVHATGVVYARFFPDGRRVLSADNDHRAYIWDAQTARIEQTFDSIHLPARLSPDGHCLFAGTEVWDIASGQIIKILDGEAKDLQCLALSPDGSLLLTSESEGLTKVWKVREHILKPAEIEDFEMY